MDLNGDQMHDTPIYFSLDGGSPSLGVGSPADIYLTPAGPGGVFGLFAGWATMGLAPTDDLDALAVYDTDGILNPGADYALFSLTPFSPYLAANGLSPADILVTDFTGQSRLFLPAGAIGLMPADNVDALDVEIGIGFPEVWEIPEPAMVTVTTLGLLWLVRRRRT
jgi:hypothetical protein